MWRNEKAFVGHVMQKLKGVGFVPQRIESASTVPGFPDMYVLGLCLSDGYFIEFKNMKDKSITDTIWRVPWRAGQQAWAQEYRRGHELAVRGDFYMNKYSWTFVGLKDGVLLIRMYKLFKDNVVEHVPDAQDIFIFSDEEFARLNIRHFLMAHSYSVIPSILGAPTWGDYLLKQFDLILRYKFMCYSKRVTLPDMGTLTEKSPVKRRPLGADTIGDAEPSSGERKAIENVFSEYALNCCLPYMSF